MITCENPNFPSGVESEILLSIKTLPLFHNFFSDIQFLSSMQSLLNSSSNPHIESQVNNRRGFTAAVLTPKHFFLRVNRLNYLLKIDIPTIDRVEISKSIIGKKANIIFSINSEQYFFEMTSTKIADWIRGFEKIGVPVFKNVEL